MLILLNTFEVSFNKKHLPFPRIPLRSFSSKRRPGSSSTMYLGGVGEGGSQTYVCGDFDVT